MWLARFRLFSFSVVVPFLITYFLGSIWFEAFAFAKNPGPVSAALPMGVEKAAVDSALCRLARRVTVTWRADTARSPGHRSPEGGARGLVTGHGAAAASTDKFC